MTKFFDCIPEFRYALWAGLATVILCLYAYCPRFAEWSFIEPHAAETYRAAQFLMQCSDPLTPNVDPAIRARLLLPVLCHLAGLKGAGALVVPWAGILLLAWSVPLLLLRLGASRIDSLLGTLVLGTTSALIVSAGWLGINDAWVWSGLAAIALGAPSRIRLLACLLLPWVDERFVIGLPLAVAARTLCTEESAHRSLGYHLREQWRYLRWLAIYLAMRCALEAFILEHSGTAFLTWTYQHIAEWLRPLFQGWWQGLRLGWAWIGLGIVLVWMRRSNATALAFSVLIGITVLVSMVLAKDLSRSAAIMVPLMLASIAWVSRLNSRTARVMLLLTLLGNLLIPTAHWIGNREMRLTNAFEYLTAR